MDAGVWLAERVVVLVPLWLSLTVHEWAHAWTANQLGDDTAMQTGRMTLDPFAHIDPLGTFLLPLLGVPFGWAKPVPVNPTRFDRNVRLGTGMALVAFAGPLSNVVLAALGVTALSLLDRLAPGALGAMPLARNVLVAAIGLNAVLAVFNLLPFPPLDGSRIVDAYMPVVLRPAWDRIASLGPLALIPVLLVPELLGFGPVSAVMRVVQRVLGVG